MPGGQNYQVGFIPMELSETHEGNGGNIPRSGGPAGGSKAPLKTAGVAAQIVPCAPFLPSWKMNQFTFGPTIYSKTCNNEFAKSLPKNGLCLELPTGGFISQ